MAVDGVGEGKMGMADGWGWGPVWILGGIVALDGVGVGQGEMGI